MPPTPPTSAIVQSSGSPLPGCVGTSPVIAAPQSGPSRSAVRHTVMNMITIPQAMTRSKTLKLPKSTKPSPPRSMPPQTSVAVSASQGHPVIAWVSTVAAIERRPRR